MTDYSGSATGAQVDQAVADAIALVGSGLNKDIKLGQNIMRDDADGVLIVSGGSTDSVGGLIELHGQSATNAFDIVFKGGSTVRGMFDQSAGEWLFNTKLRVSSGDITATNGYIVFETTGKGLDSRLGNATTVMDFDMSEVTSEAGTWRWGRNTNTSGTFRTIWYYGNGSSTIAMQLNQGDGNLIVANDITSTAGDITATAGDVIITAGRATVTDPGETTPAMKLASTHASFANNSLIQDVTRAASSGFSFLLSRSNVGGSADIEFRLSGDGNGTCDGAWTGGGADYAEYFEWLDGNPDNEDRVGITVTLDSGKIRKAEEGDTLLGVISANPSVVGDGDIDQWKGKYLKDDFNRYLKEVYTVTAWDEVIIDDSDTENVKESVTAHSYASDQIPEGITPPDDAVTSDEDENGNAFNRKVINPDFVEGTEYTARSDRKEWDTVGLVGKLRIKTGEVIGANWIKMQDISENVSEYFVK